MAREFYVKQCRRERWSTRELERQLNSLLFERLALSRDKEGVVALALEGRRIQHPADPRQSHETDVVHDWRPERAV